MNRTVPIQWKGRNVHLQHIEIPKAPPGSPSAAEVWDTILSVQGDGNWYSVKQTRRRSRQDTQRLYEAIKNRAWHAGYTSEVLTVMPTSSDGICFNWICMQNIDDLSEVIRRKEAMKAKRRKEVPA